MNSTTLCRVRPMVTLSLLLGGAAIGHDLSGHSEHPHYDFSVKPPEIILAQARPMQNRVQVGERAVRTNKPAQAAAFEKFAPKVSLRWDERFLLIESNGLPSHNMMVGITAWQQQVPLPQAYTGTNAWQLPLAPVVAREPASIKNRFLRGAIAIAVNGIPIFNPQNNRGEISQEIGELDEWGGHCGRADDYHYHAAPLHLQSVLGPNLPVAYALDGYPIFGLTEPDGTAPAGLDSFNGHTTDALGYHYHASNKYPYVHGGFHGEVVERDGQVDPQPRAGSVREALQPLRGAKITGFESTGANNYKLSYDVNGDKRAVAYAINADGTYPFEFQNGRDGTRKEIYPARPRGPGGGGGDRADRGRGPGGERGAPPPREGVGGSPPRDDRGGPQRREGGERPRREGGERERSGGPRSEAPQAGGSKVPMDELKKPIATFTLSSPGISADGKLPIDYTGDGSGATLPLTWEGAPAGTRSFAVVMDHLSPGNQVKSYWTMWGIPADTNALPKNVKGVGQVGTSFKGAIGYQPPHSQGPGEKTYVLTVYALSTDPQITLPARAVSRDVLLTEMKDKVLASASMNVFYSRDGTSGGQPEGRPSRNDTRQDRPDPGAPGGGLGGRDAQLFAAAAPPPPPRPDGPRPGGKGGAGGGLVKAAMTDTIKGAIYADNWFALYINGRLAFVDPIAFLPHNVVSVDLLPEYPMTIAVIAHDNADPKTGLEYGDHIGDAGLALRFADGTVTDSTWKVKSIERGPIGGDIANPRVETEPRPVNWFAPDFDDSRWENATTYTEERVNPKPPFYEHDFKGAQFIWSKDLDLDNTVLFRKRIEKPGWTPRWTAQPAGPLPVP